MKNTTKLFSYRRIATAPGRRFNMQRHIALLTLAAVLIAMTGILSITQTRAAGIDDVAVTLNDSEAVNTTSQVQVDFTFGTLNNGDTIKIYLGETTAGTPWQLNSVTTADITCSDDGTGEAYTTDSVAAASGTLPMWTQITATTVGVGATAVTCLIGDGSPSPINPNGADGYSVAVVTSNDSGAGIAYVGDANDVTVSVAVLPNLSLTIDNADGSSCTTTSGVTSCDLGVATTAAVNTGSYDVTSGTNAASGVTVSIAEDGDLRNGSDVITDITEDTGVVTAGSTEYGIAVTASGTYSEQGNFTDDDTPIPAGPATVATTAGAVDKSSDQIAVTHRVAIDSTVKALTYSHIVTWTAAANF